MLREAINTDCDNLRALSLQVWLDSYALEGIRQEISSYVLETFSEPYFLDLIENPRYQVSVVYDSCEKHLLGYSVTDKQSHFESADNSVELKTLYVSRHFQGKGIGRQLIVDALTQNNHAIWLSCWAGNQNAIAFYQHLGFEQLGELYFELQGERHLNLVLGIK